MDDIFYELIDLLEYAVDEHAWSSVEEALVLLQEHQMSFNE